MYAYRDSAAKITDQYTNRGHNEEMRNILQIELVPICILNAICRILLEEKYYDTVIWP